VDCGETGIRADHAKGESSYIAVSS
jgi:hypothetical protein